MKPIITLLLISSSLFTLTLRAQQVPAGHAPGMLGVALDELEASDAQRLKLPEVYGAWVRAVGPGSPAEKVGIQADDVVISYNGQRVESAMALSRMVSETPAGRTAEIKFIRNGRPVLVQAVLGKGKLPAAATAATRAPRSLGVYIEAVEPAVAQYLELEEDVGMIVRQIQPGSAAARAELQEKDILIAVNGKAITSAEVIASVINNTPGYEVPFTLIRGGQKVVVPVGF